eukprot:g28369.t1
MPKGTFRGSGHTTFRSLQVGGERPEDGDTHGLQDLFRVLALEKPGQTAPQAAAAQGAAQMDVEPDNAPGPLHAAALPSQEEIQMNYYTIQRERGDGVSVNEIAGLLQRHVKHLEDIGNLKRTGWRKIALDRRGCPLDAPGLEEAYPCPRMDSPEADCRMVWDTPSSNGHDTGKDDNKHEEEQGQTAPQATAGQFQGFFAVEFPREVKDCADWQNIVKHFRDKSNKLLDWKITDDNWRISGDEKTLGVKVYMVQDYFEQLKELYPELQIPPLGGPTIPVEVTPKLPPDKIECYLYYVPEGFQSMLNTREWLDFLEWKIHNKIHNVEMKAKKLVEEKWIILRFRAQPRGMKGADVVLRVLGFLPRHAEEADCVPTPDVVRVIATFDGSWPKQGSKDEASQQEQEEQQEDEEGSHLPHSLSRQDDFGSQQDSKKEIVQNDAVLKGHKVYVTAVPALPTVPWSPVAAGWLHHRVACPITPTVLCACGTPPQAGTRSYGSTDNSVAFSSDGTLLVSGSNDKSICLWSGETGDFVRSLQSHSHFVLSVAFSADGKQLASGSGDTSVRLWDVKTGQAIRTLQGHSDWVESVAFSKLGLLASGSRDNTIRLWNAEIVEERAILRGHRDHVESVAWSPDSKRLASASRDDTVNIWKANGGSGQKPLVLKGHSNSVKSVVFLDQKRLVSGSMDTTVRLWSLKSQATRERCRCGSDDLTLQDGRAWLC